MGVCNKKLSVRLSESITLFRLFLFFIASLFRLFEAAFFFLFKSRSYQLFSLFFFRPILLSSPRKYVIMTLHCSLKTHKAVLPAFIVRDQGRSGAIRNQAKKLKGPPLIASPTICRETSKYFSRRDISASNLLPHPGGNY